MIHFKLEEFLIDPEMRAGKKPVPLHVADKVYHYHIPILNQIRKETGKPVVISEYSGYRPIEWELNHDRSGNSQHTFTGDGAVDIRLDSQQLLDLLIQSEYRRICIYNSFVHCDFKGMKRLLFEDENGEWKYISRR